MKILAPSLVLGLTLLSAASSGAVPATQPAGTPAVSHSHSPKVIKDLDIPAGTSVADVLQRIQHEFPDFQYVAVPGAWQNYTLPRINLRDVTPDGIVNLLATLVPVMKIDTPANTFFLGHSVYVFQSAANPAGAASQAQLAAYGLADPVERLGVRNALVALGKGHDTPTPEQVAAGHKKALEQVLSLLESAATQADPSVRPSLKLHEETEVLLVTGTRPQQNAISQSLKALQSVKVLDQYKGSYENLAHLYENARAMAASNESMYKAEFEQEKMYFQRVKELATENQQLKARLQSQKNGSDEKH